LSLYKTMKLAWTHTINFSDIFDYSQKCIYIWKCLPKTLIMQEWDLDCFCKFKVCLVCIFIFCFHFLFLFSENCVHFQKIWILKTCLIWFFVFCFHEIKILKIYDILTYCLFVFLNLLKITFIVTTISFYPKWDFCSQLKTLETKIYCFHFLIISCFHFH